MRIFRSARLLTAVSLESIEPDSLQSNLPALLEPGELPRRRFLPGGLGLPIEALPQPGVAIGGTRAWRDDGPHGPPVGGALLSDLDGVAESGRGGIAFDGLLEHAVRAEESDVLPCGDKAAP